MSSDHQDTSGFQPPSTVEELHRQPMSSTAVNNLPNSPTLHLPQTPSTMPSAIETNTPESPIATTHGGAICTTPPTSFDGAAAATTTTMNTHNPVPQTLTDTISSVNQDPPTITTTPPNVSEPPTRYIIPSRRSHFDPIKPSSQEPHENKKPPPTASSPPPKSSTSPPESSTRYQIPQSRMRKMGDSVREFKQRIWEVMRQSQEHAENDNPPQATAEQEAECVAVERPHGGCFKFQLRCSCGNREGICRDVAFFLNIMLIFCVFFMIGISYSISYSILLFLSILFP